MPLKHRGINHLLITIQKILDILRDPTKNMGYLRVSTKNNQGKIGGKLASNNSHGTAHNPIKGN